jgi:uncharacterized RDD family membrane protein YckC
MTSPPAGALAAPASAASGPTPSLLRRMASFTYEALLLFGLGLIPGALGAMWIARAGQASWQSDTALRVFALLFYGAYFVWCWSTRGQTLAMQTWRIRLVGPDGSPPTRARALGRYAACCAFWFLPATLVAGLWQLTPWPSLGVTAAGVVLYALAARLEPTRQFWHDRLCRTRLVDVQAEEAPPELRRRPR